jgi:uncharacterized membrane protein (DUF485 family)
MPAAEGTREVEGAHGPDHHPEIDWKAAERSPEFKELIKRKRSFVVPATIFFMAWYFGFIVLAGYAPDLMGESVYEGLTVGYVFALSQFVMVWVLAKWYLNRADKVFDPLAEKAASKAIQVGRDAEEEAGRRPRTRRFDPAATEEAGDGRTPAPTSAEVRR